MYELIQVGENTYYINSPAKMGIYRVNQNEVYLIDSGNDKGAGKKILKLLNEHHWNLVAIINTHSHADHTGGNKVLAERTGCPVYAWGSETALIRYPHLEPSLLYGGYPFKNLRNKFLMAAPSEVSDLAGQALPEGLEIFPLRGHFLEMIGVKTADEVYFLADCLSGENILAKYHVAFIYDVGEYLKTLDQVARLPGKCFVPAHAGATEDIKLLVRLNREKVEEIIVKLMAICETPRSFEDILKAISDSYGLTLDYNQYVLVGSTIRSYLAYLYDREELRADFAENRLFWHTVKPHKIP